MFNSHSSNRSSLPVPVQLTMAFVQVGVTTRIKSIPAAPLKTTTELAVAVLSTGMSKTMTDIVVATGTAKTEAEGTIAMGITPLPPAPKKTSKAPVDAFLTNTTMDEDVTATSVTPLPPVPLKTTQALVDPFVSSSTRTLAAQVLVTTGIASLPPAPVKTKNAPAEGVVASGKTKTMAEVVVATGTTPMALPAPVKTTKTLADVILAIDARSDFSPARRRDLKSAISKLSDIIGRRPEEIPADPAVIRSLIATFHPIHAGISDKRWKNILAAVHTSLTLVGVNARRRIYEPPADPTWLALWLSLPKELHRRHRLIRFMRYCADQKMAPTDVTDNAIISFRDHLESVFLTGDPQSTARETVIGWNLALKTVPGWPEIKLVAPSARDTYGLPFNAYPPSFQEDVERWLKRMRLEDPLDDRAPTKPMRSATLASRQGYILSFAAALVRQGRDPSTITRLADLVAVEAFKAALMFFYGRHGDSWSQQAHNLAKCLTGIAEHYVEVDTAHLKKLKEYVRKTRPVQHGLREKNRKRLRQLDDDATRGRFLKLPETLVRLARKKETPTKTEARLVMRAVAIEILIFCAFRLKNLTSLHLDRHFGGIGGKQNGKATIVIPAKETKNEVELHFELNEDTVRLLCLYIDSYRPLLMTDPSNRYLFPGVALKPRNPTALSTDIKRTVFRHSGIDISTHTFRHFTAKLFLDTHPGQYEQVRRFLGHKDIKTTIEFYVGLETAAAARHVNSTLLGLRDKAHRPRPKSRRRNGRTPNGH